jgi:hypothetical protein
MAMIDIGNGSYKGIVYKVTYSTSIKRFWANAYCLNSAIGSCDCITETEAVNELMNQIDEMIDSPITTWDELANAISDSIYIEHNDKIDIDPKVIEILVTNFMNNSDSNGDK